MKRSIRWAAIAALMAAPLVSVAKVEAVVTWDDGFGGQAGIDRSANQPNDWAGFWGDAAGGVAGRPFVETLSVTTAGVTTPVITNGTATTPESTTPGTLAVVITPTNLCKPGQTPAQGVCYSSPNRLSVQMGYIKSAGDLGFDLSNPRDRNSNPITMATPLTDDSVIDLVLNMNTWGSTLRWSWVNGVPTYWNVENLGTPGARVHLKFKPATAPSMNCTTQIPVEPCDPVKAQQNYPTRTFAPVKVRKIDMILSLDTTGVPAEFNGALFTSVNADIASLVAAPAGGTNPAIMYGIAGPSELDGTTNTGAFYTFVSDTMLTNYYGATAEAVAAPDFVTSDLMKISRADGGVQGAQAWTRVTDADFGTTGYLLSVTGIQYTGKTVSASGVHALMAKTNPAKWKLGSRIKSTVTAKKVGANQSISARITTTACKGKTCRWVVAKATNATAKTSTKLKTATARQVGSAVSSTLVVKASKGNRLLVTLQVKSGSKWKLVTSRMVIAK